MPIQIGRSARLLAAVLALSLLFAGCGRRDSGDELSMTPEPDESSGITRAEESASASERAAEETSLDEEESADESEPEPPDEEDLISEASSDHTDQPSTLPPEPASPQAAPPVSSAPSADSEHAAVSQAEVAGERVESPAGDGGTTLSSGDLNSGGGNSLSGEETNYLAAVEQGVIELINQHRAELGIAPLDTHGSLTAAARIRSWELWNYAYFAHTRPDGGAWSSVLQVEVPLSYRMAGENLASVEHSFSDRDPAQEAAYWFETWKNSPGHYANMIRADYTHVGVGVHWRREDGRVKAHATTLFAAL